VTITTNPSRDEYISSAGQTVFNYTFKIYANNELDVYVTPAGQQANDATDITTDYVVDPVTIGDENGGFITFNTPLNSGDAVTIVSGMDYDRTVDYQVNGDFIPSTVNTDNDRQVSQIKQVLELARKAVVFGQAQQSTSGLTSEPPEAGKYIRWKSDLSGFENVSPKDVGNGVVDIEDLIIVFDSVAKMAADVSGIISIGQTVITTGYYFDGDGGGNQYKIVAAGTGADDGGSFIDLATHQAKGLFPGSLRNVKQFGALGDSTADDTAAIQNALNYASTIAGASGAGNGSTMFFPTGGYLCNNITWPTHVNIEGEETRLVTLFFNGVESAGSTVLICNGQSFARLSGMAIFGWKPGGTALSENLLRFDSGAIDLNFQLEDIAFKGCKFNAVEQAAGQVVNFHIKRTRFDAVGGYGVKLLTFLGHESRPFSIEDFTLDNNNVSLPAAYSGLSKWGLGLLRYVDGGHNTSVGTIRISNGRIEKNVKYTDTTYGDYTTGETIATIALEGNAASGAGQYKLEMGAITVTGGSNIETGEALAASSGYTSSSAATVIAKHCVLASPDSYVYVDNNSVGRNLRATVIEQAVKQSFERSVVRASLSANQTGITSGGSPKIVEFNSVQIDSFGELDTVTNKGRFTPSREGWYKVTSMINWDAGVDLAVGFLYILKNGSTNSIYRDVFNGTNVRSMVISDIVNLNGIGDYLEIAVFHQTGSDRALTNQTTLLNIERLEF